MKISIPDDIIQDICSICEDDSISQCSNSAILMKMISSENLIKLISKLENVYGCSLKDIQPLDLLSINDLVIYINKQIGIYDFTIKSLFEKICGRNVGKIAFKCNDISIKYEELKQKCDILSSNFIKNGICKGNKLAIILENRLEYIYIYFALFNIGAYPVPINIKWESSEIIGVLKDVKVDALIYQKQIEHIKYYNMIPNIVEEVPSIKFICYLNSDSKNNDLYAYDYECKFEDLTVNIDSLPINDVCVMPEDIAIISYTSGTTGKPKGVVLINSSMVLTCLYSSNIICEAHDGHNMMPIAPLYSAQGFISLLMCFTNEGTVTVLTDFNLEVIIDKISEDEIDIIHTQPTMWSLILSSKEIKKLNNNSVKLIVTSGSYCSPKLGQKLEEVFNCRLINVYGLSESTSSITITCPNDENAIRYNTVGKSIPGVEIKIVDIKRNTIRKGEIGELATKGYVMKEYFNDIKGTAQVKTDRGWFYTGDIAKYYDDDNISIIGRIKDIIIRGGFNVYPSDIEVVLMQNDKIVSVAVVGKPHEIMGEQIIAFVVPAANSHITRNEVLGDLRGKIANYKIPDNVIFISRMPIVPSGKVDKNILRNWMINGTPSHLLCQL